MQPHAPVPSFKGCATKLPAQEHQRDAHTRGKLSSGGRIQLTRGCRTVYPVQDTARLADQTESRHHQVNGMQKSHLQITCFEPHKCPLGKWPSCLPLLVLNLMKLRGHNAQACVPNL